MTSQEMQERFIANQGAKPKHEERAKKPLARGKRPRQKSDKQTILDAKWAGIKEGFLFMQSRYETPHCEECGLPGNAKTLDLDHIRRRGQGGEYAARNARLLCNRFNSHGPDNCHDRVTGTLQWSAGNAGPRRNDALHAPKEALS